MPCLFTIRRENVKTNDIVCVRRTGALYDHKAKESSKKCFKSNIHKRNE